jgi:hypothetical protein
LFSVVLREETLLNLDRNSESIWTNTGLESSSPGLPVCGLVWSALAARPDRTEPYLKLGSSGLVETLHMASGPFYILLMYSALMFSYEAINGCTALPPPTWARTSPHPSPPGSPFVDSGFSPKGLLYKVLVDSVNHRVQTGLPCKNHSRVGEQGWQHGYGYIHTKKSRDFFQNSILLHNHTQ